MKLIYHIILRISVALTFVLTVWALFFYAMMVDEINDEVDDSLEDYSELIIIRSLAGEELPSAESGSNNQYYLTQIDKMQAETQKNIQYKDSMIYISEKRETEPARILTTLFKDDNDRYFQLTVSTPNIEKEDLKDSILLWMVLLYIVLLIVIIAFSTGVFYRNMRPLYAVLRWIDRYQTGRTNEVLKNDTRVTEFRKLNEAVIGYAERNEHLFEQQKQFIGNASHEIQTPLAICRNRLEMLMEDETLTEAQLEELNKTLQTLEYITKLNKTLLLLSRIDNGQFVETKELQLNDLLKHYLEDYKEVYEHRRIETTLFEKDIFKITMNESLATILLTNLLKNAFVHNRDGGTIVIEISTRHFLFRNTGEEHSLDQKLIFQRFHQGTKKEGSTGLGLAIVDSICKLQQIDLQYSYQNGEHCFCISAKEST